MDLLVKDIIDRTASNEKLENYFYEQKKEQVSSDKGQSEETRNKVDLINSLSNSRNFSYTHTIIADLSKFDNWTIEEREDLFEIAVSNSQVRCILADNDIKNFYTALLEQSKSLSENARKVKDLMKE